MRILIIIKNGDKNKYKYYDLCQEKKGFRVTDNIVTLSDEVWKCSDKIDNVPAFRFAGKDKYNTNNENVKIYRNYFDPAFELIYVDDKLSGAMLSENRISLFRLSLSNPVKHALATYIGEDLSPNNKIETLTNIKSQLDFDIDNDVCAPTESLFLSTKINGETCLIFISIDKTYIFSMKMKKVDAIIRELDRTLPNKKVMVFLGEIIGTGQIYLFLECHNNGDFRIDIKNMEYACLNIAELKMNTFIIGERRQDAFKRILELKPEYPTDGIVFGNIWTKEHRKWKPIELLTTDFLILQRDKSEYSLNVTEHGQIKLWSKIFGDEWKKYVGIVTECAYINGKWKPIRDRKDRNGIPNSLKTANSNWSAIKNPITKKELLSN